MIENVTIISIKTTETILHKGKKPLFSLFLFLSQQRMEKKLLIILSSILGHKQKMSSKKKHIFGSRCRYVKSRLRLKNNERGFWNE